jgi:ubiquinol-cytochrome c reductase iron-sulfur subunit
MNRIYLVRTVNILILIGFAFALVPFVRFLISGNDLDSENENGASLRVDLADLKPGHIRKLKLLNWPVWVYHRTPENIAAIHYNEHQLKDYMSNESQQPADARNPLRSLKPNFFVFVPLETKRHCQVRFAEQNEFTQPGQDWAGGFVEPCYGSRYDLAGHIFRDSGHREQRNLRVPNYRFTDTKTIRIDAVSLSNQTHH